MSECRCLFPAVVWDREICEGVGGQCIPEADSDGFSGQNTVFPWTHPELQACGAPLPPSERVQYVSHVPPGFFEPGMIEDPDNRRYTWEDPCL